MIERVVILSLVVYRLSHMIAIEEGPFSLFSRLRGHIDPNQTTWIGRGIRCVLCVSFWISSIAMIDGLFVDWFAVAGGVLVLARLNNV